MCIGLRLTNMLEDDEVARAPVTDDDMEWLSPEQAGRTTGYAIGKMAFALPSGLKKLAGPPVLPAAVSA
ncbi:hypothetical protein GUJ93_ZPchr0005g14744 [Zizania palustris]|uniref:Uncharacterized protein n=1 Tax=Zizania palustris TaxID=103762 RepID=A0A8J5VIJ1_ZIZPA|nr:hypothetical protein GUJ93_ZPchr0005g14744 [Zizania palustris]